jgi:hypothetical protein
MTIEEKAKYLADQCKPCTNDFYSGIYQGALIALKAEQSDKFKFVEWMKTEANKNNLKNYGGDDKWAYWEPYNPHGKKLTTQELYEVFNQLKHIENK